MTVAAAAMIERMPKKMQERIRRARGVTTSDPFDYPRCEICKHAVAAACGHPGPVTMTWSFMSWPNTNYDSCCDKYERDAAALRAVHRLAERSSDR